MNVNHASLFTVAIVLLAGCGGEPFPLAEVAGRVTLDGEPLAGARIWFQPQPAEGEMNAGEPSIGKTDDDGRFTLVGMRTETPGAVIGTHRVLVRTAPEEKPGKEILPLRYHEESELTFVVPPEGTDEATFALTGE